MEAERNNNLAKTVLSPSLATAAQVEQNKNSLCREIEKTFQSLSNLVAAFDSSQLAIQPFENSWTAGQVVEHIVKATSGIPDGTTTEANRPYTAMVDSIQSLFLDLSIKMTSPDFVLPDSEQHDKTELLNSIADISARHRQTVESTDITALCLDSELLGFGYLTRYEWLQFIVCHTQRHTHQLQNIYQTLNKQTKA